MKEHKELKKLVVFTLEQYSSRGYCPRAKELYHDIASQDPKLTKNGFRSFVKIVNSFKEVEAVGRIGAPKIYKVK